MFSKEQLAAASKQQAQDIAVTAKFMSLMGFGAPPKSGTVSFSGQYDSLVANAAENKRNIEGFVPNALLELEKKIKDKGGFSLLFDSINTGVTAYRNRKEMDH